MYRNLNHSNWRIYELVMDLWIYKQKLLKSLSLSLLSCSIFSLPTWRWPPARARTAAPFPHAREAGKARIQYAATRRTAGGGGRQAAGEKTTTVVPSSSRHARRTAGGGGHLPETRAARRRRGRRRGEDEGGAAEKTRSWPDAFGG